MILFLVKRGCAMSTSLSRRRPSVSSGKNESRRLVMMPDAVDGQVVFGASTCPVHSTQQCCNRRPLHIEPLWFLPQCQPASRLCILEVGRPLFTSCHGSMQPDSGDSWW